MLVQQECTTLKGRSGPSGLNDDECRKIILSKSFGESPNGFCSVLANESKKIYMHRKVLARKYRSLTCVSACFPKHEFRLRTYCVSDILRTITGRVV